MRALLPSLLLAAAFIAVVPAVHGVPPLVTAIQPGAQVSTPVGSCTLNFVFTDATNTYIGTAGHCADAGDRVSNAAAGLFGTVVFDEDGVTDFALIRVDAGKVGLVSAGVRQWGGPTGVASTSTAAAGDTLALYGFGIGFGSAAQTRPREGVLLSYNGVEYRAETAAVNGDSGAPLLDLDDGKAVGIISHFDLVAAPPATDEGPTVDRIQARLAAAGFAVTLQTAAFHGSPI